MNPSVALVALADPAASARIAGALRACGLQADTSTPHGAFAALVPGRHAVAAFEYVRPQSVWNEFLEACEDLHPCARVLALCAPGEAFRALAGPRRPAAYALQPILPAEVANRITALAKGEGRNVAALVFEAGMVLEPEGRHVFREGTATRLGPREFGLLRLLLSRRGEVVTRDETAQHLYRWGEDISSNTVDVHIHNLRRRLAPLTISTVRGSGYVLV